VWAGVDSAWEQEKLEARKMLENAAESHTSGARFVGQRFDALHILIYCVRILYRIQSRLYKKHIQRHQ
jgi:hypothetical protein